MNSQFIRGQLPWQSLTLLLNDTIQLLLLNSHLRHRPSPKLKLRLACVRATCWLHLRCLNPVLDPLCPNLSPCSLLPMLFYPQPSQLNLSSLPATSTLSGHPTGPAFSTHAGSDHSLCPSSAAAVPPLAAARNF